MNSAIPSALVLTREQPALVKRLDRDRALHRIRMGVYMAEAEWKALTPWERYAARVQAVARTWTQPAFCLESAAVLQALPIFGEPRFIHLISPDARTWREGDVIVHGWRDGRRLISSNGMLTTELEDSAVDLCRVLTPAFALAVADAALRSLMTNDETLDFSARGRSQPNRRGLQQLDWVQQRATAVAESVGESVSRAVVEWLGYGAPELQREFRYEGETDRTDFYWLDQRTIGESDGYGKYDAADAEASKKHFIAEKRREDRLRRHEGGFVRWDWADTMRWVNLDAKLRAGGMIPVRLSQPALLHTLASNPRSLAPNARTKANPPNPGA